MTFEHITLGVEGGIARLTFNRPAERNAMTAGMGLEIKEAVGLINENDEARVVVITGAGKSFCSGANLRTLGTEAGVGSGDDGLGSPERFYRLFLSVRDLRVPSIAAINGHAIGAGLCFALATDMRVMKVGAKVGVTFVKLGIHPGMAATWNLPRLIGPAAAADLLYTGRVIGHEEALAYGLVNRVAGDDFEEVVTELAQDVAASAPLAVRALKQTLAGTAERTIDDALVREATVQAGTFQTEDAAEGIGAILEKRRPQFKGR